MKALGYFRNLFFLVIILFFASCSSKQGAIKQTEDKPKVYVSEKKLNQIHEKYGQKAYQRVKLWDSMMHNTEDKKIFKKLKNVNDFFNKMKYKTDIRHWKRKDYWATPFEFMGTGAGDCEDFAIAKYFSLRQLAVAEDKLRINYVIYNKKNTKYEQNHMVLTYFHKVNSTPIILDNIDKKLKLASKRKDLKSVYSFNAEGLWKAKKKDSIKVGENKLKAWKDLMNRMEE